MKLPICDVTPFTLLDFPNHTACIMWFAGCNMRCVYCHNPELVLGKKKRLGWDKITQFLYERKHLLDGVVLSGGECTLVPELVDFVDFVRGMGYKIKLDTNGLRPDVLSELLIEEFLDYVALDYKAPKKKFKSVTNSDRFDDFSRSLNLLCESGIQFEVRTTVHSSLLDTGDVNDIMDDLESRNYCGDYYVQNVRECSDVLGELSGEHVRLDIGRLQTKRKFFLFERN